MNYMNNPPYDYMNKFTSSTKGAFTSHFSPQYTEGSQNIWGHSSLKPSSSIWGFNAPHQKHKDSTGGDWDVISTAHSYTSYPSVPLSYHSSTTGIAAHPYVSPRQSITSLSSSNSSNSSPLWGEDSFLFSPPLSPESQFKSDLRSASPPHRTGSVLLKTVVPTKKSSTDFNTAFLTNEREASESTGLVKQGVNEITKSPSPSEQLVISCSCGPLYVVQFKGSRRDIFTAPGTTTYSIGNAVMVDADRGRDLGVITQSNISRHEAAALKQQQHNDRQQVIHNTNNSSSVTSQSQECAAGPTIYTPKQILCIASVNEIKDLSAKVEDEKKAVSLCNKKVSERNLDMVIVDAEYQWDRRKLTFFYTAESRVDFRDLVRELFRIYKTRIWMCATTARN